MLRVVPKQKGGRRRTNPLGNLLNRVRGRPAGESVTDDSMITEQTHERQDSEGLSLITEEHDLMSAPKHKETLGSEMSDQSPSHRDARPLST
jgi:hypothetical protein